MPAVYATQNCIGLFLNVCVCVCARARVCTSLLEYRSLVTGNNTKGRGQSVLQFRPLPQDVSYGECTVSDIELSLNVMNNTGQAKGLSVESEAEINSYGNF